MTAELELLTLAEAGRWAERVMEIPGWDVYWLPGYARCWEANGDGEACLALWGRGAGAVAQVFLRRAIPGAGGLWDITTPYGYGGPLAGPSASLPEFHQAFETYCRETGVVSEFIRFHPLLYNHRLMDPASVNVTWRNPTVYLDLAGGPVWDSMRREPRNRLRRAERAGVTTRFTLAPVELASFQRLYAETMARRGARAYYFFSPDSFEALRDGLGERLLLAETVLQDGTVLSAGLFMVGESLLHYHLGGSDAAALDLAPNNKLFHDVAEWGRERGLRAMHLGGGVHAHDSLMRFKAGFSPLRADFLTGTRVFDGALYAGLVQSHRKAHGRLVPGYFPEYRAPEEAVS